MNKSKTLYALKLIGILFVVMLFIAGGTFAYWTWSSDTNKNVVFTTAGISDYIIYDEGDSQFVGDFKATARFCESVNTTISVYKTPEAASVNLTATIYMDVNSIGTNIAASDSVHWVLTEGDSNITCADGLENSSVINTGTFKGISIGEGVITLATDVEVTLEEKKYTVWIWVDSGASDLAALSGETVDTNVWTKIDMVDGTSDPITDLAVPIANSIDTSNATTLKSPTQSVTLNCSDDVGVVGYYFGKSKNPTSYTAITSTKNMSKTVSVNSAGTYYLVCKDAVGNISTNNPSAVFASYVVENRLLELNGTKNVYNTTNYALASKNTYLILNGTSVTSNGVMTVPTGGDVASYVASLHSNYDNVPSTGTASINNSPVITTTNNLLMLWINRLEYTISYDTCGGSNVPSNQVKRYGETISVSNSKPTKTGYKFLGWSTADSCENATTVDYNSGANYAANANETLYAVWDIINYSITYELDGGTMPNSGVVTSYNIETETFNLPTPTKSGYAFVGWYTGPNGTGSKVTQITKGSTGNKTYYAHWVILYTITFNSGNLLYGLEDIEEMTDNYANYSVSNKVVTLTPNRNDGWAYTNGRLNLETGKTYTFNATSDGTWGSTSGSDTVQAFVMYNGSNANNNYVSLTSGNSMTFTAPVAGTYWLRLDSNQNGKTHTFSNINVSYVVDTSEVGYGLAYGTLPTPTRTGYTFNGWYTAATGGTKITSTSIMSTAGNQTLYAQWTPYSYNISYVLNGGSGSFPETATYDNRVNINNPTKIVTVTGNANGTGANVGTATSGAQTFAGWTFNGNTTTAKHGTKASIETVWSNASTKVKNEWFRNLTATNGGTVTMTANWTSAAFNLPTVSKPGYNCNWNTTADGSGTTYESGASYTPSANSVTSLTLYARCTIINYSITYNANGGTMPSSGVVTSYNIETATFSLPTPSRTGYTFGGWYTSSDFSGSAVTQITKGTTGNKTFYAKWTPTSYTITYNLNGGVNPSSGVVTSYNIETATFNLPTPTKSGYTFSGWYTSSDFSGSAVTQVAKGTTGNKTFYAKWTQDADTTKPTYTSAEIKNVTACGYDVYVYGVSDASGINRVQFPTWTTYNGQDDIQSNWQTNSSATGTNQGNGTYYFRVNVSDHNRETGEYNTHIYIYDNADNSTGIGLTAVTVPAITVTIGRNNTSWGTVSASSVSVACGTTYSTNGATLTFSNGSTVTASPTAATGYTTTFSSWSSTSGTITEATTITANFSRTANGCTFSAQTLTAGTNQTAYSASFTGASNGTGSYTYSINSVTLNGTAVTASSGKYNGLGLSGTTISGTPTKGGTYVFSVTATDNNSAVTCAANITIVINPKKLTKPTPSIACDGKVTWSNVANASKYQISINNSTWTDATSGVDYLSTIQASLGSRKVYVRAVGDGTNFSTSDNGTASTTVYQISYDACGGSGAPSAQKKLHGCTLTLSSTKPTRTGYTFNDWSNLGCGQTSPTIASGGSHTYNPSTSNYIETLGAVWKGNSYQITYNANGGELGPTYLTPGESVFNAPVTGSYKIEVWGGEGGRSDYFNTTGYNGGYGGYATGEITLSDGDRLYVNVGGMGEFDTPDRTVLGGYNGGGSVPLSSTHANNNRYVAGGGGATHVARVAGQLSTLSSNTSSVIIVAAGGGGSYAHSASVNNAQGGHGGGISGTNGNIRTGGANYGTGGSQNAAGFANAMTTTGVGGFGYGGDAGPQTHGSGGGGGWYGGGGSGGVAGQSNSAGGGGSGYIGNSSLTNKSMTCYSCATSSADSTKTTSTTNYSGTAISGYAKRDQGAAKIISLSSKENVTYGDKYGTLIEPSKEGYVFDGWYLNSDLSGTEVTSETLVATASGHTLYAKWEEKCVDVVFYDDSNNEKGRNNDICYTESDRSVTPPSLSKSGHTLIGWYTTVSAYQSSGVHVADYIKYERSDILTSIGQNNVNVYYDNFDGTIIFRPKWKASTSTLSCEIRASANSTTVSAYYTVPSGRTISYYGWNSSYSGSNSTTKTITGNGTVTYYVKDSSGATATCSATISATSSKLSCPNCSYCYDPNGLGACYYNGCSPSYCNRYVSEATATYYCPSGYTKLSNSYCFKKN